MVEAKTDWHGASIDLFQPAASALALLRGGFSKRDGGGYRHISVAVFRDILIWLIEPSGNLSGGRGLGRVVMWRGVVVARPARGLEAVGMGAATIVTHPGV